MAKIKIIFKDNICDIITDATIEQFNQMYNYMNNPRNKKYKCFLFEGKNANCMYVKDSIKEIIYEKDSE